MLSQRTHLHDATTAGLVDRAPGVGELPAELEVLAAALAAAGRSLAASASRVVPAAEPFDPSACSRYQRAAATWPTAPPPSHERFAGALARLHEAADATRLAARRCDEARGSVEALLHPAA